MKNISAKDNSYSTAKQNDNSKTGQQFLDVSTTPGGKRSSSAEKIEPVKIKPIEQPNSIEATTLQIKYSGIIGVLATELSNTWLLQNIDYWMGTKYCMGGSTENCIDCSAFTQTLMQSVFHIQLPRTSQQQFDASKKISDDELQQGDLVFFHTTGKEISHVGVYIANNKVVHASGSNGVTRGDLNDSYWKPRDKGEGRVM